MQTPGDTVMKVYVSLEVDWKQGDKKLYFMTIAQSFFFFLPSGGEVPLGQAVR